MAVNLLLDAFSCPVGAFARRPYASRLPTYTLVVRSRGNESRLFSVFRALHHRNYQLFFTGQLISLTGTWMQAVAVVARLPPDRFGCFTRTCWVLRPDSGVAAGAAGRLVCGSA